MRSKAIVHYSIDVAIMLAFLFSAVSGFVLLFAPAGYQGGRNPHYAQTILFLSNETWTILHTWGSIAMVAGVLGHLILHWKWMVRMTKNRFRKIGAKRIDRPTTESVV